MIVDIGKIISKSDLENNFEGVCDKLEEKKELIVFSNNKPTYVIMTIEQYQSMEDKYINKDNESEEQSDESLETLLNKIGKKIFVDYYYVFKEDINPEERLSDNFTLNSRRSRSSSARKIFKNGMEIAALNNIIQSFRLDEDTLDNAKIILKNEIGNTSEIILNTEEEKDNEIKIGKSARTLISKLLQESRLTNDEIDLMKEANYSKRVFNLNLPVLKEVDKNIELDQQKKDQRGYNRYYDTIIPYARKEYLLCSQWVENLHRSAFEKWLEPKLMIILIGLVNKLNTGTEFTVNELLSAYWYYVPYKTRKSLGRQFVEKVRSNTINNVIEVDKKIKNCQVYRKY